MRMCHAIAIVVSLVLDAGLPSRAAAQLAPGAVEGFAKTADDGTPIPFVLVRLLPADPQGGRGQQGITSAEGRFHFAAVPAGEYRLELLRIGYRPVRSPALQVRAGETMQQDIRATMTPIPLPTMMVYPDGACLTGADVAKDPYLSAVWEDVRQGVEIRRAFDLRYRFTRSLLDKHETKIPSRPAIRQERADTTTNEPDSVPAREQRQRARRQEQGYGNGNSLQLPDEKDLFDESFLHEHCLVPTVAEADGAVGLRFRQATSRRDGFGIQGTIWVDASTHLMRALELEHLDGDKPFSEVRVDYADLSVAGSTLRLPSAGTFSLRPVQAPRETTATGTLTFSYWGFEEIRPK